MRIPRFGVPTSEVFQTGDLSAAEACSDPNLLVGKTISLRHPRDVHHLKHVLRGKTGDTIDIFFTDAPLVAQGRLLSYGEDSAEIEILKAEKTASSPGIHLLCGLPKSKTADVIVEKGVELGVASVIFFLAERTQGRLDESERRNKQQRFARVALAAQKQSGSTTATAIEVLEDLPKALKTSHSTPGIEDCRILLTPPQMADGRQVPRITDLFLPGPTAAGELEKNRKNVDTYLVLGPEGGLTEAEIERAKKFAYREVSLSHNTLRCDTAAMLAAALVAMLREN